MWDTKAIRGVVSYRPEPHVDSRGWLRELFRNDELPFGFSPVMGYAAMTEPGVARGPHEHTDQTDLFLFMGTFRYWLWDNRRFSETFMSRNCYCTEFTALIVPPGVVHAYRNDGDSPALVLNFPDRLYKGRGKQWAVDEIRHELDKDSAFKLE